MKVAIAGFGLEGQSSFAYFSGLGHEVIILDQNSNLTVPKGAKSVLGDKAFFNLSSYDQIIRSSGLSPDKLLEPNPGIEAKITTQLNEFLKVCPSKHIIGVTGTKGKGTTSTLITRMLEANNLRVVLGGNIGVPMLDLLADITPDTYVVLELSSFQLIDLKVQSPSIALCLMMTPEHLNWHPDLEHYIKAKAQLFSHQSVNDIAIYFADNELSKKIASNSPGQLIPYFAPPGAQVIDGHFTIDNVQICKTDEIKLLGKHNWQNICAAITAVWQVVPNNDPIRSTLLNFSGLEHRLELVSEINGVKYYDDSFGTTPNTAVVAIEAFSEPIVLIVGGSDKGLDYSLLVDAITSKNVKHVICIGDTGPKIYDLIKNNSLDKKVNCTLLKTKNMEEVVKLAHDVSVPGDIVLLSTGSASFNMFKNYKDRGEQFKKAVLSLSKAV